MSRASDAQRNAALRRANEVRVGIAATCREIRALPEGEGRARLAEILEKPDDLVLSAGLARLLKSIKKFGDSKTRRVLRHAGVSGGDRKLGEITHRQRRVIAEALRDPRWFIPSTGLPRVDGLDITGGASAGGETDREAA